MTFRLSSVLALLCLFAVVAETQAAPFLSPSDFIIAIDTDDPVLPSNYPSMEAPAFALDSLATTKYLNFAEVNSGLIVEPFIGATTVQSLQLTTANDAVERDPLNWELYGTNDFLSSTDNGDGSAESWTLIASGDANLPETRETLGPVYSFANSTSYSAYRILFPTVKDVAAANSMQVADVNLFESTDGSGFSVWDEFDSAIAFAYAQPDSRYPGAESPAMILDGNGPSTTLPSQSSYPGAEGPGNVVDGTLNKYLNGGDNDSGFIVTPASGSSIVQSFRITTANDDAGRDPTGWALYGTNDAIQSLDNSFGMGGESWTLIDSGAVALPTERNTLGPVVGVTNGTAYTSYKMVFPTLAADPNATLMQIAEAEFFSTTDGTGANILSPGDTVLAIDETLRFNSETKYLNFGAENSGFIITPAAGSKVLTGFQITTANDAEERDPASYEIYGTNDAISSEDNSKGDAENWTLIASGDLTLPTERLTEADLVSITNSTAYSSYRVVFPTLKDAETANSMQIATIEFFDDSVGPVDVDLNDDGKVDGADFLLIQQTNPALVGEWQAQYGSTTAVASATGVPEPSAIVLAIGAVVAGLAARKRLVA
ncbi:MAG: hypothetical protein CMJ58_09290 [Planctomycetaceae bacterium]|nr:hypothetical protein [Planctomycetaceae bacterium]